MKCCVLSLTICVLGTMALLSGAAFEDAKKETSKALRPVHVSVNTKADEDEPYSLGNTLFFSSNAGGKTRIMMSTRANALAPWGKPQAVVDHFETEEDKSAYFISERSGFQYFFFATVRDKEAKNFDIFVVQRTDPRKVWSALTAVQAVCTDEDEMHPWITSDRKTMYFSRKTKEGWRVYSVTRPTALGPQFQGEALPVTDIPVGFLHATLTPDGRTMYLQGPLDDGRWGLFVTTKTGTKWAKPEVLDTLNSAEAATGDRAPALTPDGGILYFSSDRPGGKGGLDLWMIPTNQIPRKK